MSNIKDKRWDDIWDEVELVDPDSGEFKDMVSEYLENDFDDSEDQEIDNALLAYVEDVYESRYGKGEA